MSSNDNNLKIEGHEYDGIEELDNSLPNWWLNLFYLTILFAVGYFIYFELGDGKSLLREYQDDKAQYDLAELVKSNQIKIPSEEELLQKVKEPNRNVLGVGIFQSKCASCHGNQGQGGIGPNLTDNYWLHGAKLADITTTITKGVLDKGMPPWGPVLSQDEIVSVVAYIHSIHGSNPPGAKAPQGELITQ